MVITRALAAASLLAAAAAAAQSIEQSYADQCSAGQQSETCDALRKALMDKLAAKEQPGGSGQQGFTRNASVASVWGAWADLAGTTWLVGPDDDAVQYSWEEPGRVLLEDHAFKTGRTQRRVVIATDGSGLILRKGEMAFPLSVTGDGEYAYFAAPKVPIFRVITRIGRGSLETESQILKEGKWEPNGGLELARTLWRPADSSAFLERAAAADRFERLMEDPVEVARRWGAYAQLAGNSYLTKPFAGYRHIVSYRWVKPGHELEVTTEMPDASEPMKLKHSLSLDRSSGSLAFESGPMKRIVESGGAIRDETNIGGGTLHVKRLSVVGHGQYEETLHAVTNGKSKRISRAVFTSEAIRNAKSGDSGLLGALIGAGVGAAAGAAAGLDTGATMEAMVRGASVAAGNSPIGQGLARGWAEETAKQTAMQQSMEDARNRGLAQGAADYARSQSGGSYTQSASTTGAAVPTASQASPAPASGEGQGLAEKSVRVWLSTGMRPTDANTVNPSCISNTFTVNVAWDPKGWGNIGRVREAVAPLEAGFLANCRQHGTPTSGVVQYYVEGLQDGFANKPSHPQFFYVNL